MEKKIKFSENPKLAKIVYSIVIAVLCISAIVIGIVAANNRDDNDTPTDPSISEGDGNNTPTPDDEPQTPGEPSDDDPDNTTPESITFISPVSGTVITEHSMTVPVFSPTLEEWRVHTGIDISTAEAAAVFAAADGTVTEISTHPRFGYTVKILHANGITTVYSNLSSLDEIAVKVGDVVKCGDKIATVGDSAVYEIAEETHLHFAALDESGAYIDPLDIISDESKEASLGISVS